MKNETITLTYELVDEIKDSKEYKKLLELKVVIAKTEEIQNLISNFNKLNNQYNEVAKYGKYHPDLKKVQKEFSIAKDLLYNNEVVKEYRRLEKFIQKKLDEISRSLAESISKKIKYPNELGLINKH